MRSDPRFQAQVKARKELEEKAKSGESIPSSGRRMILTVLLISLSLDLESTV